jgi:NitT/TauT family transport system substrate-binding protein
MVRRRTFLGQAAAALGATVFLKACATPAEDSAEAPATESTTDADAPAAESESSDLFPIRFTLDWAIQGVHAPVGVAIAKGYFEAEGLDVQFERGQGSADSITKVASGAFDMGFGDINSLMEFNVTNPDTPVKAIAIYYNKSPMSIMSLDETGITEPAMLEGKVLGIPAGSATRRMLPLFAQTAGFDLSQVEVPAIESKLQQTLLLTKEIDAIAPFTISALPNLNAEGYPPEKLNIFRYADYGLDLYGNAVLAPVSFLEANPEQVQGFLRALTKGLQDTLANPDEAVEIMSEYDELYDVALERERLQIAIDTLFLSPEVEENGFGAIDIERFEKTIGQVVEAFEMTTTPKPEDVFDGSFLPPLEERQLSAG